MKVELMTVRILQFKTMLTVYEKYLIYISSLYTNKQKGTLAPHKAILLLSVIDLIEQKAITVNEVELSELLENQFKYNWRKYVGKSTLFTPKVATPFIHLDSEPFWKLIPFVGGDEEIQKLKKNNPYAVGTIRKSFRCAKLDVELFELLNDENVRAKIRTVLISNYLESSGSEVS